MPRLTRQSLRLNLMLWLGGPVALILIVSLWLSYSSASRLATLIQTRDLTSSARMIAEQVRYRQGLIEANVPPAALEIFATDAQDEAAYAVFDPKGNLIAGFPGLNPPKVPANAPPGPIVYNTMFRTEAMHAVLLRQPVIAPDGTVQVLVTVGETGRARAALVRAFWMRGFAEQAALVLAAAISIWVGINWELRPLTRLSRAVRERAPESTDPFEVDAVQAELRPLVSALNDHMARLGAYLDRQRRFLDGAAHQMRTPLAILKTQIGVARRGRSPQRVSDVLEKVDASLTAMTRTTNQLLTLGRVEHERARPASLPQADLREVLREVVADIAPRALDHGLDLVLEAEAPVVVRGNPVLLREIVVNLVENAIQHAGEGATAHLSAHATADGRGRILLADTGPGVSAAGRAQLFRRFTRGSNARTGGTGLGLTIVAEIAEMFDGSVTLPDPDAPGFRIAVDLPLEDATVAAG